MESRLTKLERDAVFQLIQLSGSCDDDFRLLWVNFPVDKDGRKKDEDDVGGGGGSAGAAEEALSSSSSGKYCFDDEPLPRTKPKFGSLLHIYRKTHPLIKNHAKKRPRF